MAKTLSLSKSLGILLASSAFLLSLGHKPSMGYSVSGRGDIFLSSQDLNKTLDPIRSADPNHSFEARLTLIKLPFKDRLDRWRARFNLNIINNTQNASLFALKHNGRAIKVKGNGGVLGGTSYTGTRALFLKDYDSSKDVIALNNIKIGWKSNQGKVYTTETVPEPFTIFGTAMALGFGYNFKRRQSKRAMKPE